MDGTRREYRFRSAVWSSCLAFGVLVATGCAPSFRELRFEGQKSMAARNWGAARHFFKEAHDMVPEDAKNLHDLGACSTMLARRQFEQGNRAAALREIERAVEWYTRAIDAYPGFDAALLGKNRALELKGQFEEALDTVKWAARFVGPSAKQYIYLATEYEERGDLDQALLRYQQAAAMEPDNAAVYKALGMLHKRVGNKREAVDALERSLHLDPLQSDVASMLRSMGEPVPAVDLGESD